MTQVNSSNNCSRCPCSQWFSWVNTKMVSPCHAAIQRIWQLVFTFPPISGGIDCAKFFVRFLKEPNSVGALFPSSKALAREIVREIPEKSDQRIRILEIGPGTGAFTKEIVKRMGENATLDLVEFDGNFVKVLQRKHSKASNVTVYHQSILEYSQEEKYDYIISGLPFNSFSVEKVKDVFEKFRELSVEGAKISYFEYPSCSRITNIFSKRTRQISEEKERFFESHGTSTRTIWGNLPPARVRYHEVRSSSSCA